MMVALPRFRYHPDPLATGSIKVSDTTCVCCQRSRGYIYFGPLFAEAELDEALCPWCIADGAAHRKFDAEFTDRGGVGDYGTWESVDATIVDEVTTRTPGFCGWQQERWYTCCGDAGIFLGRCGRDELLAAGPDAIKAVQDQCGATGDDWDDYFAALDRDGSPTAYLFRCDTCKRFGAYSDCD